MCSRDGGKRNCCITNGRKMEATGRWTAATIWTGRLKQTFILNSSELRFLLWTAGFFSLETLCQDGGGAVNYLCYGPYLKSATPQVYSLETKLVVSKAGIRVVTEKYTVAFSNFKRPGAHYWLCQRAAWSRQWLELESYKLEWDIWLACHISFPYSPHLAPYTPYSF